MRLDRNISSHRRGKYALIKLRVDHPVYAARATADGRNMRIKESAVDFGNNDSTDFFVIRLKDKYAGPALRAYADAARKDDPEYAAEIFDLAIIAEKHPHKRIPD